MVHPAHFIRRVSETEWTGTMSYMTTRSTPLVLWQYICKQALWVYALMAFAVLCMIPCVRGSAFLSTVPLPSLMSHPRLSVLAKRNGATPEPSPSRSSSQGDAGAFNRESLKQSRLKRSRERKQQERENKKCSGKTGCKDCPFGGSGCVGGEDQCIYRFPNQNYNSKNRRASKKVD